MRFIAKGAEPHALLNWKRENKESRENLHYEGGGLPREAVRAALLAEQYYLCAYTMRRLQTSADCHIEHLLPQSRKDPAETIDYNNLLACYPASNSKTVCEYGAHAKADYDPGTQPFCSPLHPATPGKFRFGTGGQVEALTADAEATLDVLRLNHPILVNDRAAVIWGSLHPAKGRTLSAAEARRLAERVRQPDAGGRLPPYCEAVAQLALKHAEREERRAARMRGKQ